MTLLLALAALAVSAVPIVLLCIGDPKRRRTAGEPVGRGRSRAALIVVACLPGLACALRGDSAAFMLWLGGAALLGWCAAAVWATRRYR